MNGNDLIYEYKSLIDQRLQNKCYPRFYEECSSQIFSMQAKVYINRRHLKNIVIKALARVVVNTGHTYNHTNHN